MQILIGISLFFQEAKALEMNAVHNQLRAEYGLTAVQCDHKMNLKAQKWAKYMAEHNYYEHSGVVPEVIHFGPKIPKRVFRDFKNSKPHRIIILGRYTKAGYGHYISKHGHYWVIILK